MTDTRWYLQRGEMNCVGVTVEERAVTKRGVTYWFAYGCSRKVAHEYLRLARQELERRLARASRFTPTFDPDEAA